MYISKSFPKSDPDLIYNEIETCPELVTIAAVTQFFIIATIGWMACEGIHLYFNVVAVFRIPKRRYLMKLSFIGWLAPLILVAITLIVEETTTFGYKMKVTKPLSAHPSLDIFGHTFLVEEKINRALLLKKVI